MHDFFFLFFFVVVVSWRFIHPLAASTVLIFFYLSTTMLTSAFKLGHSIIELVGLIEYLPIFWKVQHSPSPPPPHIRKWPQTSTCPCISLLHAFRFQMNIHVGISLEMMIYILKEKCDNKVVKSCKPWIWKHTHYMYRCQEYKAYWPV